LEQSSVIKCPSSSYHSAGTKKVQRELAKPHDLERYSINHSGKQLGLDSKRVPENTAINKFAEALALAWKEQ